MRGGTPRRSLPDAVHDQRAPTQQDSIGLDLLGPALAAHAFRGEAGNHTDEGTSGPREAGGRQREAHGRSGQVTLEGLGDLFFGDGADDLLGHLAALEDKQRGDAADVEPAGGVDVFVHVQLDDF